MPQQRSTEAENARQRAAALLADTIGHTDEGVPQEREGYIRTVRQLDGGEISSAEAIRVFDGITGRRCRAAGAVVVVGQAGRDIVLQIDRVPDAGGSAAVETRLEMVGGKGVNQAVGLRQLGAPVRLVAVVGADAAGEKLLHDIAEDGTATEWMARRGVSALLVDIVDGNQSRRLLEHVPSESQVTADDIHAVAAAGVFDDADTVCLQLQQPVDALVVAATLAKERHLRVVLDGAVEGPERETLLGFADVVRANAAEAQILTGANIDSADDARRAAHAILDVGPGLVVLTVDDRGELVAWADGDLFIPFGDEKIVDPTGAGDAFVAGLVTGLREGLDPGDAGRLASKAAAVTIGHLGGRPNLAALRVDEHRS